MIRSLSLLIVALLAGCESQDSNSNKCSAPKEDTIDFEKHRKEEIEKQRLVELNRQLADRLFPQNDSHGLGEILTNYLSEFKTQGIPVFHVYSDERPILRTLLQDSLRADEVKKAVFQGDINNMIEKLLEALKPCDSKGIIFSFTPIDKFKEDPRSHKYSNPSGGALLDKDLMRFVRINVGDVLLKVAQTSEGVITRFRDKWQVEFNHSFAEVPFDEWTMHTHMQLRGPIITLINKTTGEKLYSFPFMEPVRIFNEDGSLTTYGKALKYIFSQALENDEVLSKFWQMATNRRSVEQLSNEIPEDVSDQSLRTARTAATGSLDLTTFKINGVFGQSIELGQTLFVQLKGDVSSAKLTELATGYVAYRLGNTVIGAIQGYANSGAGFGTDSRQLETSVVASHSFGSFFVEGQIGSVSANDVHLTDWSGYRSQITLGLDTEFVSPFVQITYRQLNRDGFYCLNETSGYIGLDMDVANLKADTYSISTHLLTKIGCSSNEWLSQSKEDGSTSGFKSSLEWSGLLNINNGARFKADLCFGIVRGVVVGFHASLMH